MECFGVVADDEACDLCWTQPSQTMYTLHIVKLVTFFDPAKPSDSIKKYANGMATNNDK